MMHSVIIADDEPWAVFRIRQLLEKAEMGFEVVGTANDGISALALVKQEKPALLLSDIRMPGLDGLALVRQVKEVSPETITIIVTGFSDFSYAVDALRQGVFDFLVKPIDEEKLGDTLRRVKQRLEEQATPSAYDLFFTLFNGESSLTLRQAFEALGIAEIQPFGLVATCSLLQLPDMPLVTIGSGAFPAVSFRTGRRKLSIMLQADAAAHSPLDLLKSLSLPRYNHIGISQITSMNTDFALPLLQSEIAMETAALRQLQAYPYSPRQPEIVAETHKRFEAALQNKSQQELLCIIEALYQSAQKLQMDDLLDIVNDMTEQLSQQRYGDYDALELRRLYQLGTSHLLESLLSPLERAIRQHEARAPVAPSQFQRILQYIDEGYTHNLMLSDLSKHFYLTTNYLSILIKRETGMTFSELLIQKRIERAKQLLLETDYPIQDIMEQVGYRDYSSFIKLFQKHTACTPYAFRKSAQSRDFDQSTPRL